MIVCHQQGLVYLAPPKTGSTSIRRVLMEEPFNGILLGGHAHHGFEWSEQIRDYFFFITVRHPYTRVYSLWRYFCNRRLLILSKSQKEYFFFDWFNENFSDRDPTLDEFLYHPDIEETFKTVWRCSWQLEQLPESVDGVVVRQERYDTDMRKVPQFRGRVWDRLNSRADNWPPWHEVMTDEHCDKVQELWGEDFERFRYNRKRKAVIVLNK